MTIPSTEVREKLIASLAQSDERRRVGRADRIIWVSQYQPSFSWVVGTVEVLTLLSEAHDCYVAGHFTATVLVATAFIEHTVSSALLAKGYVKKSPAFSKAIEVAREHSMYTPELLVRCDALRQIRNPLAHRRPNDDPNTLGNRYMTQGAHPQQVLEADAQEALKLMYAFFSKLPTQA